MEERQRYIVRRDVINKMAVDPFMLNSLFPLLLLSSLSRQLSVFHCHPDDIIGSVLSAPISQQHTTAATPSLPSPSTDRSADSPRPIPCSSSRYRSPIFAEAPAACRSVIFRHTARPHTRFRDAVVLSSFRADAAPSPGPTGIILHGGVINGASPGAGQRRCRADRPQFGRRFSTRLTRRQQ